jgi:hypothetical protein
MRTLLIFILAALFGVEPAAGQTNPDSVKQRNDCRLAEQILASGQPRPHAAWASTHILTCGPEAFISSVTAGLQRLRSSSDTAGLSVLWNRALLHVNSQPVFDLGLEIAADPSATPHAREFAFLGLLRMLKPHEWVDFETLTRTDRAGRYRSSFCYGGVTAGVRQWVRGTPIDASARSRLRQVGAAVQNEAAAPGELRAAAYCAAHL